jgi:HSP20 family molecular chaperone IbpA
VTRWQFAERVVELPRDAARDKVSARLADGMLRVSVGKIVEEGGRSVTIE